MATPRPSPANCCARWGVVFRDVAAREPLAPAWRDLLVVLRRMESRGEIRGGRFVAAFLGEQFALPEALDLLRAIRRSGETATAPEGPGPWTALQPAAPSAAAAGPLRVIPLHRPRIVSPVKLQLVPHRFRQPVQVREQRRDT